MQPSIPAGFDVTQTVVDEYCACRVECATFNGQPEDAWIGFRQSNFSRYNDMLEPLQKLETPACNRKRFGRPVGQRMQPVAPVAQLAQNCNASGDFVAQHCLPAVAPQGDKF